MRKKFKLFSVIIVLMMVMQSVSVAQVGAADYDDARNLISVAENEVGYMEITYADESFYSKYGDWYGYPNGAWCAMFVSWCADQANISQNTIPKFASCSVGKSWFENNGLWRKPGEYEPKSGDIVFLNNCTHVGIVKKYQNNILYTIEGNACDDNGENYGVRERNYVFDSSKITGYGVVGIERIIGDFDGDNNSTTKDVLIYQKHLAKIVMLTAQQMKYADLNGDGEYNTRDVLLIQKIIAKIAIDLPTEPSQGIISPSSIEINNTNPNVLNNGDSIKLNAEVKPDNATDKTIVWSSSNPDVASVDSNGLVTAKTAGTVTIKAMSLDGSVSATATVRVNQLTSYIPSGNYCLRLKGTSSYLDHQGGGTNGTNIHLWEGDGNSNANQKIALERIDDNRYMLKSAVNKNFLVDVNRGSSYSDPIEIGKNIDLWENNDWEAQEWLFTKTYDGYYIIRLNMKQGGAVEAGGTGNGSNIYFGTYNPDNDMQKWELISTSVYIVPETSGWIYNTQPVGNVNVRSGPGTNYPSIGGFNEGQQITIIGSLNGDWYKVRGANRHDGSIIEGYSHKDYVSITPPVNPDNPAPNLYSNSYNKSKNPFAQSNLFGQCTWYAWGRANEITGKNLPCRGDAKTWYSVASSNGYSVGSTPRKNSIAVWSKGTYGHVAYVEKVEGNSVTITESNWDRTTYSYQYDIESGIYYYSGYKTLSTSQMNSRFGTLLGYIYL